MAVEAAGYGAVFVEAAGTGGGIDDRAGVALVAGEEPLLPFVVRSEEAGGGIAGEVRFDALPELAGAGLNVVANGGGRGEPATVEAGSVLEGDGEEHGATFAAAGAAGNPFAGLGVGLRDGGGHRLQDYEIGCFVEGHRLTQYHQKMYLGRMQPTPLEPIAIGEGPAIWCKLEFLNPSGSTKDRIARFILEKASREGRVRAGDLVAEASSGSTSIAMALVSAQLGLRFTAVMPEGVSAERTMMIRGYGGAITLTPKAEGIRGALAEVERLGREEGAFLPRQFENLDNALAHRMGTAREIIDQIPGGDVAAVVSGVGTGGTLVGLFEGLREAGCGVRPVLAKPVTREAVGDLECCSFSARIPGVVDELSKIFSPARMPGLEMIEVQDGEAIEMTRELIRRGFPVGPSSGLNYCAAQQIARRVSGPVVTVFPDRMERYFTTELFSPFR
jgi:cysteine synthase